MKIQRNPAPGFIRLDPNCFTILLFFYFIMIQCQDYELDFSMSRAWFGGDWAAIVGECACPGGMFFNDGEMQVRLMAVSPHIELICLISLEINILDKKKMIISYKILNSKKAKNLLAKNGQINFLVMIIELLHFIKLLNAKFEIDRTI